MSKDFNRTKWKTCRTCSSVITLNEKKKKTYTLMGFVGKCDLNNFNYVTLI